MFKKISFMSVFLLCFCLFCTGCRSTEFWHTDIVEGNSRTAGKLEATVEALDTAASSSRERVGKLIETSRSIEDGIEKLEYLFTGYEREVERLQCDIERIRKEAGDQSEDNNGSGSGTDNGDNYTNMSDIFKNQIQCKGSLLAESDSLKQK